MTTRAGGVFLGASEAFASATETRPRNCQNASVYTNATVLGSAPPVYKNQGWYAAGSIFETWVSIGEPSTFPPSGHTLTQLQHIRLEN